jgi:hypothetical protein
VSFLGEARRFLIPHEILKPTPGLLGGWLIACSLIFSLTPSFTYVFIQLIIGSCVHSLAHSFIHHILTYHSLIHPHSRLGLGKGNELSKSSHGIVGCSGRWCNPSMT